MVNSRTSGRQTGSEEKWRTYIDGLEVLTLVDVDAIGDRCNVDLVKVDLELLDQVSLVGVRLWFADLGRLVPNAEHFLLPARLLLLRWLATSRTCTVDICLHFLGLIYS